ncbi:uncharacterized protein EV154DRAFT_526092 [Mucor mucedo]|uniref:MICOS complex subunit MIC19 n=1 Tax=Mucor saturninus TaxID=64648 RepID=A0A8H7QPM5_9FUNG|nr:uncharacterized protein EV154DRAFT_526092 [Mucor mucedo]KAG2195480.1 hypothetical protein INT47_012024 [Mucor saturninus]KAI7876308.1 hypothetical protein EV154DRAFT_526092 [Mucor mucedo]
MGSSASKPQEPVIFYNPSVPLQFSTSLVQNLEKKAEQTTEKTQARQVEAIVQQRVTEELEKLQQEQAQLKEKFHVELSDNVNATAPAVNTDIQAMVDRISRSSAKEVSPEIKKAQEEVVACYNNNKSRTLDCWKQVENFKQAVTEEQKKFVGAHQ